MLYECRKRGLTFKELSNSQYMYFCEWMNGLGSDRGAGAMPSRERRELMFRMRSRRKLYSVHVLKKGTVRRMTLPKAMR